MIVEKAKEKLRQWKRRMAPSAVVLVYHHIGDLLSDPWSLAVAPERFEDHLRVLRRRFRPLSLLELTDAIQANAIPPRSVAVTFDDGYADNLYVAKPLLERYDIPATVFVTTGNVGRSVEFWWDELEKILLQPSILPTRLQLELREERYEWQLDGAARYEDGERHRHRRWRAWQAPPTRRHELYASLWKLLQHSSEAEREQTMQALSSWAGLERGARVSHRSLNADELTMLAQGDGLAIGAHSVSHRKLSVLSSLAQQEEILTSKRVLEETLNRPIFTFAYPYGKHSDYTNETKHIVQNAGYRSACSNVSGLIDSQVDPYALPRMHVHDWTADEFAGQLAYAFSK